MQLVFCREEGKAERDASLQEMDDDLATFDDDNDEDDNNMCVLSTVSQSVT